MTILPLVLIAVLVLLAALHAYWGLGGNWPGHDELSLVETVVGRTRGMRMPGLVASLLVAAALLASAALAALKSETIAVSLGARGDRILLWAFWTACAVFGLRGLAGYIPPVFEYARGTVFARLNMTFYSPLCLFIAASFAMIGMKTG
ncbi:MAG: DUF3995 domain-containing protein [Rhizomicrobium sp.]|jgi:hypothetical protein